MRSVEMINGWASPVSRWSECPNRERWACWRLAAWRWCGFAARRTEMLKSVFASALLLIPAALFADAPPAFWTWASRPVMGWNSWDFYGTSINEERTKAQTDYLAANLLSHGWNLITVD